MAKTGSYIPPQSPIAIQPGDKGFEIVGKGYNRWLWTYPDWKKKKKKIINPAANWELNAKPMSPDEIKKKMKGLYLQEDSDKRTGEVMENIKTYESFVNESENKLFEVEFTSTSPTALPKPNQGIKASVVKQVSGSGNNQKVLKGAFRFQGGPKGTIDYKLSTKIPLVYSGPIVPSKFWKSNKGNYYVLQTNVKGQQQEINPKDMKSLISSYKLGKSRIVISKGWGITLTFTRTWDFKDK